MNEDQKNAEVEFAKKKAEALLFLKGESREELLESASDFYAMGAVAYEALGHRRPLAAPLGDNEIPFPSEGTSPIKEALSALQAVMKVWEEIAKEPATEDGETRPDGLSAPLIFFSNSVVRPLLDDPETSGDAYAEWMSTEPNSDDFPVGIRCMITCSAYAVQTIRAEKAGEWDKAWISAAEAKYWSGIVIGTFAANSRTDRNPASAMAKMRHAENYALRDDVERYWRERIDSNLSAQKAADQIVRENVVPLSHKKIAEIFSLLRKKERVRTT